MKKNIIRHLKHDIKESMESIREDKKLLRKLRCKSKKTTRRPRLWD